MALLAFYVGVQIFIALVQTAFESSPLTGIGFIVSVCYAVCKGILTLKHLSVIFVGTIISFATGSLIPNFINSIFAGQFFAVLVFIFVIWFLHSKVQEIQGT